MNSRTRGETVYVVVTKNINDGYIVGVDVFDNESAANDEVYRGPDHWTRSVHRCRVEDGR